MNLTERLSRPKLSALAIAAFFFVINLIGLDRSPTVNIDEVTLNDPAKELAWHAVLLLWYWAHGDRGVDEKVAAAGLCVGLAAVTHPVALDWIMVGVALIVLARGFRAWKPVVVFVGLAAIPGFAWLAWALQ